MSQCVSCNNQPNDNDTLGGGAHEGAVTPMVVGIIAGTVVVFVLVLCALFYCAKLENDKARRGLKAEEDDNLAEGDGSGHPSPQQESPPPRRTRPSPPPPPPGQGEWVERITRNDIGHGPRQHHHRQLSEPGAAKTRPVERRPSSVTVVTGEVQESRCEGGDGTKSSWITAGVVGGKKKGLFGWGGVKKSNGRATPADNPPVTAIEMV